MRLPGSKDLLLHCTARHLNIYICFIAEEIGGGSCILLIALCLVTVFLSVGGTALYCTFGDVESSVCKDFTANMDFYYTQAAQGMEELKHWLFVT